METKTKTITVTQAHWDKALQETTREALLKSGDCYGGHCVIAQALTEAGYKVLMSSVGGAQLHEGKRLFLSGETEVMKAFDNRFQGSIPSLPITITVTEE